MDVLAPLRVSSSTMLGMNTHSSYHLGRNLETLEPPYSATDKAFAAQRLGDLVISSPSFRHCTFANISFKRAKLENGSFQNCVFVGCYFRRAELTNCGFVGCRFIDCNFGHVALKSCDFRYSVFQGCQVSHAEMEYSLPREPNLREELARTLSIESSRLGLSREARRYRITEIRAHEEHLWAATLGKSQWYKEHFDTFSRSRAFLKWGGSLLNRWLWGYGERAIVLVRNLIALTFLVFPFLFYVCRDKLSHTSGREIEISDLFYFSLENVVPAGVVSGVVATGVLTRLLAGLESIFGVVAVALFAAYVFRWSLHR